MNSNASVLPGCGMQICSHPTCWDEERQLLRALTRNMYKPKNSSIISDERTTPRIDDDTSDGLPTLSVCNTGTDTFFHTQPQFSISSNHSAISIKRSESIKTKASEILSKLQLRALNEESPTGFTPAPANTPLQTSHIIYEQAHGLRPQAYLSNKGNKQGSSPITIGAVQNMKLNQHYGRKKKVYLWQSPQRRVRSQQDRPTSSKKSNPSKLMLPVDGLPVISNENTWHSKRIKKPKKNLHVSSHQLTTTQLNDVGLKQSRSEEKLLDTNRVLPSGFEIEKLKNVPLDVLLRVVRMALNSKVITTKQATVLLLQVTGQQVTVDRVESSISILLTDTGKTLPRIPRTPDRRELPSISPFSLAQHDGRRSDMMIDRAASFEILSLLDNALTSLPVDATSKFEATPKPQKVSRITQTDDLPIRRPHPFRYIRQYQDMSLGPAPTPPPLSPSTERDSQYDDMVGGSTLMVNPSRTPTLTNHDLTCSIDSDASARNGDPGKPASSSRSSMKSSWPQVEEEGIPVEEEALHNSPLPRDTDMPPSGKQENLSRARSRDDDDANKDQNTTTDQVRPEVSRSVSLLRSPDPPPPSPEVPPLNEAANQKSATDQSTESDHAVN